MFCHQWCLTRPSWRVGNSPYKYSIQSNAAWTELRFELIDPRGTPVTERFTALQKYTSDMLCTSKSKEIPCQSPLDATLTGCCADGRRCDEVCVAIVAAEECRLSEHNPIASVTEDKPGKCRRDEDTKSCPTRAPTTSTCEKSTSCCTGERQSCGSETVPPCQVSSSSATQHASDGTGDRCQKVNGEKSGDRSRVESYSANCCDLTGALLGAARQDSYTPEAVCREKEDDPASTTFEETKTPISCCKDTSATCASSSSSASIVREFEAACSTHLALAIEKYKAFLEAGICICRNALRNADTCCDQESRAAVTKKCKSVASSVPRKSCCISEKAVKNCKVGDSIVRRGDSCCSVTVERSRCAESNVVSKPDCSGSGNDCCGIKPVRDATYESVSVQPVTGDKADGRTRGTKHVDDIECDAAREHATFSITGMTCTGCVKKVAGVLANIDGADNPKVNFVAAMGDVDINTAKVSVADVLLRLENETGFRCARIISNSLTLDVVTSSAQSIAYRPDDLPKGVESFDKVGKQTYRITYDPLVVGARSLLAGSGGHLASPTSDRAASEGRRTLIVKMWSFLGAAVLTVPVCVLAFSDAPVASLTKGIIELVLATLVQTIAIHEFYTPALKALIFSRVIEMDMLVVISITAAYVYSVTAFALQSAGVSLEQGAFFETSTLLITLVLLGRLVASYAKLRAVQAVSLKSMQADTALLEDAKGQVRKIDARLLEFDDTILVAAHSKVVSDGQVLSGESAVDESIITGESLPIAKAAGAMVTAGTLNGPGILRIKLTRLPGKNSITDIAHLVQNALISKPRIQDLADVVAGYFVPIIVSIAIIVFAIWVATALRIRNLNASGAVGMAITYAIAVLAISCPCALGLAVPLVLVISGGIAARGGVIIKQADATERGFKVTDIIFDKTGTLTTGQLEVTRRSIHTDKVSEEQVLSLVYSLVKDDTHPVAQAVAVQLASQVSAEEVLDDIKSIPGSGVQAVWKGQLLKVGNPYWLAIGSAESVKLLQGEGCTILCVTLDGDLAASFGLKASCRPEAQAVISALRRRGLTCHIVSGDQPTAVSTIAASLGIEPQYTASHQSPANKQEYLDRLMAQGKKTLFVGDGTNDAVAIAAANVGVQIGSVSDVARATADVVLLGGLEGIITLLEVSKQSFYRIVFNFVWSAVYNVFAILLASGAFVKVRIAPNYAGLGEIVSVLPVVFAALTMLKVKISMH